MKTVFVLFLSLFITTTIFAQDWFHFSIDELFVPTSQGWKLDVCLKPWGPEISYYDSIVISSTNGSTSFIPVNHTLDFKTYLITLSNDNVKSNLSLNQNNDIVKVTIYMSGARQSDSIVYGYKSSLLPSLTATTSFRREFSSVIVPSTKPQIGKMADISDMGDHSTMAYIKGSIYNQANEKIKISIYIYAPGFQNIVSDSLGFYQPIYPCYMRDTVQIVRVVENGKLLKVKPFLIKAEIGDTVYQDIYIIGETTSVAQPTVVGISVYPNPASEVLQVAYEANEDLQLVVSSIEGQEVERLPLPAGASPAQLPLNERYSAGMYVACVLADGVVVQRVRFVVQR